MRQNCKFKRLYLHVCSRGVLALCTEGESAVLRMNWGRCMMDSLIYRGSGKAVKLTVCPCLVCYVMYVDIPGKRSEYYCKRATTKY